MTIKRLPIIGVMGGGDEKKALPYAALSKFIGETVAEAGCHLLTGGGGGIMKAVSDAFVNYKGDRKGLCIGILPADGEHGIELKKKDGRAEYPNDFIEIPIHSAQKSRSRNYINIFTPSLILALPGEEGTTDEIERARQFERLLFLVEWPKETPEGKESIGRSDAADMIRDVAVSRRAPQFLTWKWPTY